jgi:hypothetical protein
MKVMNKHRLLVYERISQRMRGKLLALALILVAAGLYDLMVDPFLGASWLYLWLIVALVFLLWFYYAFLVRRAAIQVRPDILRLQGPLRGVNLSYGRVHSVTTAHMAQHVHGSKLSGSERSLIEPYFNLTCLFIELNSYPKALKYRRFWFSKFVFSTSRPGLVCAVKDWMALSRDVEAARAARQEKIDRPRRARARSLAAQVLEWGD